MARTVQTGPRAPDLLCWPNPLALFDAEQFDLRIGSNQAPATEKSLSSQQLLPTLQPSELTMSISNQADDQKGR